MRSSRRIRLPFRILARAPSGKTHVGQACRLSRSAQSQQSGESSTRTGETPVPREPGDVRVTTTDCEIIGYSIIPNVDAVSGEMFETYICCLDRKSTRLN